MKRRVRKIVNFFAFNLLFFALYLNFIHKDESNNVFLQPENASNSPAFGEVPAMVNADAVKIVPVTGTPVAKSAIN